MQKILHLFSLDGSWKHYAHVEIKQTCDLLRLRHLFKSITFWLFSPCDFFANEYIKNYIRIPNRITLFAEFDSLSKNALKQNLRFIMNNTALHAIPTHAEQDECRLSCTETRVLSS